MSQCSSLGRLEALVEKSAHEDDYDIGIVATAQVSSSFLQDEKKYKYLKAEYKSPVFDTFEVRKLGKTIPLTFQKSWLDEYKSLAYSPSQETLGVAVKTPFKIFSNLKEKKVF
ncbi:hypothetical protein EMCRGX_G025668 [Ephydatia muelleri]